MAAAEALAGIRVFERGWLSSNQVLVRPAEGESGALLVDSGHGLHSSQTLELVREGLAGVPLRAIFNTHLHADHCGGNARLHRAFGAEIWVPTGEAALVRGWDERALSHGLTGQYCPRFKIHRTLRAGDVIEAGGLQWEVHAAPGHDSHALMLFERWRGLLISGDALWEQGHGVVFPEIVGESGFDEVEWTLDVIERLPVRCVVPGHGRPFTDVAAALAQARARLKSWRADPYGHALHAHRVLLKFHLMEVRREPLDATLIWASSVPLLRKLWERWGPVMSEHPVEWVREVLEGLVERGLLQRVGDELINV